MILILLLEFGLYVQNSYDFILVCNEVMLRPSRNILLGYDIRDNIKKETMSSNAFALI